MSKLVRHVRFHQTISVKGTKGLVDLGSVVPNETKTFDALKMSRVAEGLLIEFSYKSEDLACIIPYANIITMTLPMEEEKE
jgi:hypothetical protein